MKDVHCSSPVLLVLDASTTSAQAVLNPAQNGVHHAGLVPANFAANTLSTGRRVAYIEIDGPPWGETEGLN
jgi:hypothetical protein